jgi:hypothetical protein
MCCIACGTGASKECIGNGCPGQTTPWNSCNHKWQLVSARIKWPLVSHCETHPALTSIFSPTCYESALVKMKRGGKHPTIYAIRSSSVQQVLYRKAERLGNALPNGLGHVWIGCRVQIFVNPAAEAFGSLLTAWPVLLAVFFIAPELANIAPHHRSVQTSNFLVSSGVPRTPVTSCDEQDMWTHSSEGWSIKSRALSDKHEIGFKAG